MERREYEQGRKSSLEENFPQEKGEEMVKKTNIIINQGTRTGQ